MKAKVDTLGLVRARRPRTSKYGNRRTSCGLHVHHSEREAIRCGELRLLERAGTIRDLVQQPVFPLVVNGEKLCNYIADFQYVEASRSFRTSIRPGGDLVLTVVIEDCKGARTDIYRLKKKLMWILFRIKIRET